ncbi:tetratricopeptide repeat protein [Blautia sp. HCP3S3_H10_1]|uniref:tetratricopeptide repeat protein n=1 Tax=unclassified Blautia TaxID=2648079 RepID=UPI003F91D7F4
MKNLDKEEFRVKLEEINHLVEQKDYKGAMNVVDSIDWRRVKNVRTLCVVGEIYAANKRYEDSKEIFLLAYHRASIGKNILYRLVEVSLKLGQISEAVEFYQEYREVAPNDNTQYILKYKILKAKKAPAAEQIKVLEEYKEKEFTEKWSYELAKLYYQDGDKEKCLELCNEIILWFNEGSYVMKAMDLKQRMGVLTGEEKERYEQQFVPKLLKPEDAEKVQEEEKTKEDQSNDGIESIQIKNEDLDGVESLQDKISKGLRDIFGNRKMDETEESIVSSEETNGVQEEMLRDPAAEKEYESVPELEPEAGKVKNTVQKEIASAEDEKGAAEAGSEISEEVEHSAVADAPAAESLKMPTLNIPDSMKNMSAEEVEVPKAPAQTNLYSDENEETEEIKEEKPEFDFSNFNLEDTILAAASAQGIEIPDEQPDEAKVQEENKEIAEAAKEISGKPQKAEKKEKAEEIPEEVITPDEEEIETEPEVKKPVVELEEEEFLSEEDLQAAEDEFMNGPAGRKEESSDDSMSEDEFIAKLLKESIGEDEDVPPVIEEEAGEETVENKDEAEEEFDSEDDSEEDFDFDEDDEDETPEEELSEEEELEQFIDSIQPKEKRNPADIVPREKALTDDEKKLFTYFVKVPGMKEQLISALCDVQMAAADKTSKTGNVIVMGGRETGKTRLIASLIPAICKELNLPASKVAYVFADQLNEMDIAKVVNKLRGGFLVIENANQLTQETVEILDKAMDFRTDGLTVIIEDEKIGMRKLIARFPKFAKKFTSMINIPVFTNDELVNFARVYTKENGYKIDQMGMLALYNLIGVNQKEDQPMNIGAVKEMLDTAMAKSQGGLLKFNKKKRVDRDGFTVLYEKDFAK